MADALDVVDYYKHRAFIDCSKVVSCIQELETFDSETYELLKRLYIKEGLWQIKK